MEPDFPLAPLALVTTTVATRQDAARLARLVLDARLAACVQVEAIESHYRWQGALQQQAEWRLACKSAPERVDALLALLQQHHPYELPELVVQPLQASQAYAAWVQQQLT